MRPTSIFGLWTLRPNDLFIGINDAGIPDVWPTSTKDQTTFPFLTPV